MSANPDYRFKFQIVDQTTGEVVESDYCPLTTIDQFGGSETVDIHVSSMLRAFKRFGQAEYERANYQSAEDAA